ncbi:MAG: PilZ domain-containing protein [Desulfobacterales bacterium]|nr:PilZ domain-containing protein [Desulfobacterales bacterium]
MLSENKRIEPRTPITSILLPFIGTKDEDHELFQFIIMDMSKEGLKITIPKWLVGRDRLEKNALINLHIPFELNQTIYHQGKIVWERWDDDVKGQICGIHMEKKRPLYDPIYISLETSDIGIDFKDFSSIENVFIKLFKDICLAKKGSLIYLNHLVPYFSRITSYSTKEYPELKHLYLDDIIQRTKQNHLKLETLYEKAKAIPSLSDIPQYIDLEELRDLIESEINMDVFKAMFDTTAIIPYLEAIKTLEKKQYSNYNMVVMLYIKSL